MALLPSEMEVRYAVDGAVITALQMQGRQLVPIGRAVVQRGIALLPYVLPPDPRLPILLSASMDNRITAVLNSARGR